MTAFKTIPITAAGLVDALRTAQQYIESMKQTAETAGAGGDEQMLQEACESISQEGLQASQFIQAVLKEFP